MSQLDEERMPVLIGCGQLTDRSGAEEGAGPIALMADAARRAAADTGLGEVMLAEIDTVVAVGLVVDEPNSGSNMAGALRDVPLSVTRHLEIDPRRRYYTDTGGNTPQRMVNLFAEKISRGEAGTVLITGAEALDTMIRRLKAGLDLDAFQEDTGTDPDCLGGLKTPATDHEYRYNLRNPADIYPLFENALRRKYGLTLEQHQRKLGELYQRFNAVAAANPLSWFPAARTAAEIAEVSDSNRYVGFPYTKYMNSVIRVNMGAALVMTSVAEARRLGVAEDKWVYLHGCGDANDVWYVTERRDFASSPAVASIGARALNMAGKRIDEIDFFDIYSCFPSAVQIACDELGIPHDDPRGLTITGGLPYFGGPGNNYVTHSIASMMDKLRANPGTFGLVNANGWYVTKHSVGIYSTTPPGQAFHREDPADYADEPLHVVAPAFTEHPQGPATVETYTVLHGRKGAQRGLIVGRLGDGTRFLAFTPDDEATLQTMTEVEMLDRPGTVSEVDGYNMFVPDFSST